MPANLTNLEFQLFNKYIYDHCGIHMDEGKAYLIESRLSKLLVDSGMSTFEQLYNALRCNNDPHISEKVIDAITTNETLWFRDQSPWIFLEELLLPHYINLLRTRQKSKVRIWSAAASTGQEAYSIAMCIDHYLEFHGIQDIQLSQFEILATDISHTVLQIASKGHYDSISIMRGLDQLYKDKYFKKKGMFWELDERIKAAVSFKQFNLQNSFLFLGKFDVIFCRYVLIYFSETLKVEIMGKLADNIESDGTLFIGSSELYGMLDHLFEMINQPSGTFYRRKGTQV